MIEIHPNLWVGDQMVYEGRVRHEADWCIVHACKEPYHRHALGYAGRAAPKTHPEYLVARRDNRLILNMVDADDPAYILAELMTAAVAFIHESLTAGNKVLVHCNQGMSRSPGIAMLYLKTHTTRLPATSFDEALAAFVTIYPPFNPAGGILGYLRRRWEVGSN